MPILIGGGERTYRATILADSPLVYYDFDSYGTDGSGNTVVNPTAGTINTGVIEGAASFYGPSLVYYGSTTSLGINDTGRVRFPSATFISALEGQTSASFEAVVSFSTGNTPYETYYTIMSLESGSQRFRIGCRKASYNDSYFAFLDYFSSTIDLAASGLPLLNTDKTYHFIVDVYWIGTTRYEECYLNGKLFASNVVSNGDIAGQYNFHGVSNVYNDIFGGTYDSGGTLVSSGMLIDEIAIFTPKLSPYQKQKHYFMTVAHDVESIKHIQRPIVSKTLPLNNLRR